MSLALETNKNSTPKETKSAALLNQYLKDAVAMTHSSTWLKANMQLDDHVDSTKWDAINKADVDAKRKEIKEEMKKHGLKDKMAYFSNTVAGEHGLETYTKVCLFTCVTTCAGVFIAPEATPVLAAAGAPYIAAKMASYVFGTPATKKERESALQYADLRHQQVALKNLARRLEEAAKPAEKPNAAKKEISPVIAKRLAARSY